MNVNESQYKNFTDDFKFHTATKLYEITPYKF